MSFEEALSKAGDFHRYQYFLLIFSFYATFVCSTNFYTQLFIFYPAPHRCRLANESLISKNDLSDKLLPVEEGNKTLNSCFKYSNVTLDKTGKLVQQGELIKCVDGWVYNHSDIFPSIASQNNWVCDEDDRPAHLNQAFWIGNVCGNLIWGSVSDKYGRRPAIVLSFTLYFVGNILTFVATNFWSIVVCRFLVGVCHHTSSHVPYLLALEFCGVERRTIPLLALGLAHTLASMSIPFVSYLMPSWEMLLLFATLPHVVVILGAKLMPESPAWLICQGRSREAKELLKLVAKVNNKQISDEYMSEVQFTNHPQELKSDDHDAKTVRHILSYPRLAWHGILSVIICMVSYMCYYGHVENSSNLGENIYWSFFLGACIEIPSMPLPILVNHLGRKGPLILMCLGSGIASIGSIAFSGNSDWLLTCALLGRMFATGNFYVSLQYISEVLPTVMRGSGVAACETMAGLGLFICPQIVYLGKTHTEAPLVIFGSLSLLGALASTFMPETCHETLPQTIEDGNEFGKDQSVCNCFALLSNRKKRYQLGKTRECGQNEEKDTIL